MLITPKLQCFLNGIIQFSLDSRHNNTEMGGKDKKGPRVKGNVKPSSSVRSAELLGHIPEFVGFSSLSEWSYVPGVGTSKCVEDSSVDLTIPPDFRLSLRKMGKRDSTTKIKALQEFLELCEHTSIDILKLILPYWPRIYSRLAVDSDRRVRENIQKTHLHFTIKLGRNVAPYLKEMMGTWFTSQCDPYAPSAFLATHSLESCFPGNKLLDAICFCHKEIMDYIFDSLFKVDNLMTEEQRERILIGGTSGYSLLLQHMKLGIAESEKFLSKHAELWTKPSLYKSVEKKHSLAIKQAWFGMMYSLIHFLPQLAHENSQMLFPSLFSFLDDAESITQLEFWEVILKALVSFETASTYVNLSLQITPKFIQLLQTACSGNATKFGPLIVPLVRILREDFVQKREFDHQVIEALSQGLLTRNVSHSTLEASALSVAIFHIVDHVTSSADNSDHLNELFHETIMPLLDSLIKSQSSDVVLSAIVRQLTLSFYCWFKTKENPAVSLWEKFETFMIGLITQPPHPQSSVVERVGSIILILMDPLAKFDSRKNLAKRSVRIRFSDSDLSEEKVKETSLQTPEIPDVFRQKVFKMSTVVFKGALTCCDLNNCEICLCLMVSLSRNNDILRGLLAENDSLVRAIVVSIRNMLEKLQDKNTPSLLLRVLNVGCIDFGRSVLDDISQDDATCRTLATAALDTPTISTNPIVLEWLQGPRIRELLVSTAEYVAIFATDVEKVAASWKLIHAALRARTCSNLELLLPEDHGDALINALISNLKRQHMEEESIAAYVQMLSNITKSISDWNVMTKASRSWLDALIGVLCSSSLISPVSFGILMDLWTNCASHDAHLRCQSAITVIKSNLDAIMDIDETGRLVEIFQCVLELDQQQHLSNDVSCLLARKLLLSDEEWMCMINENNSYDLMAKEIISGKYCHHFSAGNLSTFGPIHYSDWCRLLKTAAALSSIVVKNQIFNDDKIRLVPYLFYVNAVAEILLKIHRKRLEDLPLKNIEHVASSLESNANILFANCTEEDKVIIVKETIVKSQKYHWFWVYAARKLQEMCQDSLEDNEMAEQFTVTLSSLNHENLNKIALLQTTKLYSISSDKWTESLQVLASIRCLLELLESSASTETLQAVTKSVETLQSWQLQNDESFLFGQDIKISRSGSSELTWGVIEVIRLLSSVVEFYPQSLTHSLWDFVLCSMASWSATVEESWADPTADKTNDPLLLSFTVALCNLIQNCSSLICTIEQNPDTNTNFPPNLVSEWNDVFSDAAFNAILPLFLRRSRCQNLLNLSSLHLLETLAMSVRHVPVKHLEFGVETLSPLLMAKQSATQFAIYGLIVKLIPEMSAKEVSDSKEEADSDQGRVERAPPHPLLIPLEISLESLKDARCGDLHLVEPYSDECMQILGYLLSWDLVLKLCGSSSSELRYQYASYLSSSKLITRLMDTLFHIIPHTSLQQVVNLEFELRPDITLTEKTIQDIAITVFTSALRYLPAVVRRWCNNVDKRTASLVEKFTSRCVSPVLCSLDLQFVSKTWDNMTIRVRPSAREVIATYKLNEEGSMELVMQLPANYPLGNIVVDTGRKVGVTSNQWRSWILQLQTFLMQQNGSILDGLTLWKQNVDKKFEGIEECYICYYVLHGSNYQLPKLSCRTCRKKFHADCLYKWFSTSNNSTCPLCRNLF